MDTLVVTMEEYEKYELQDRQATLEIIFFRERVGERNVKRTVLTNKGERETEILCDCYKNSEKQIMCYIEKGLQEVLVEWTYKDIKDAVTKGDNIKAVTRRIKDLFQSNIYNKDKVGDILSRANKQMLVAIYMNCVVEIEKKGLDFYKYISPDELYALLQTERDMNTNPLDGKRYETIDIAMRVISTDLNASVQQAGGIINWTKQRIQGAKKQRPNYVYDKQRLLEGLYDPQITDDDKKEYARLLVKVRFDSNDLSRLMSTFQISIEQVETMYDTYSNLRNIVIGAMAKIKLELAITIFGITKRAELLGQIQWNNIKVQELKDVMFMCEVLDVVNFIVEMSQQGKRKLKEAEIDFIFESKKDNKAEMMRVYFILVQNGLYNDDKIIELYGEKIDESNQEDVFAKKSQEDVTVEELLSLFNTDRVIEKMKGYCNPKLQEDEQEKAKLSRSRFLNFYLALLEVNKIGNEENTQKIIKELAEKLKENIEKGDTTYLLITIQLFEKRILEKETMQGILSEENQEQLIDMYNQNQIDDYTLLSLYKFGLVEGYIIQLIYQELDEEQLREKMDNQSISVEDIVILYCLGVIQQLGKRNLSGANWEQIAGVVEHEKLKSIISLLYKEGNIGFDDVNKLKEMKVIGAKAADVILKQIDLDYIFGYGLTSEDGKGEVGRKKKREGVKRNEGIPIEDRDTHLKNLGFEPVVNVYGAPMVIARGSFAGYRVYVENAEKYGVIVFERETDGSSFAMHKAKAGEFIRQGVGETTLVGSRSDWREKSRTDGSVKSRSHTPNWGKNIIETIIEISSEFKIDDDDERKKYVKDETKRLCEVHKDSIEYLRMVKEELKVVQ